MEDKSKEHTDEFKSGRSADEGYTMGPGFWMDDESRQLENLAENALTEINPAEANWMHLGSGLGRTARQGFFDTETELSFIPKTQFPGH